MKLITALIQPHKLPDVKQSLAEAEVFKMTVSNVIGAGAQKGYVETYRGVKDEIQLLKKVKIEIAVNDNFVDATIKAIVRGARTGNIGDGKIFIQNLEECIRIRTDERGEIAIG